MKIPPYVEAKIKRGRGRMREGAVGREECIEFWRGNQYIYRSHSKPALISQATVTEPDGTGKPSHRVRTTRNLIIDVVAKDVAAATTRVPGYEINPSTADPEDAYAARLAGKVARYGYEKWGIRQATVESLTYALVAGGGWVWPYWDSQVGPFFRDEGNKLIGEGEVRLRVLGPNEVYWEPGIKFADSSWCAVEQALPLAEVKNMAGFDGKDLKADAQTSAEITSSDTQHAELCLVTHYLERPSPQNSKGLWLTMANGRMIREQRPYPAYDEKGQVIDVPVLHYISYIVDPASDRDMGIVEHLLDAQRTVNDATNKLLEWKNLALNPQIIIQNGEFKQRLTDEPGAIYHATGSGEIKWREVPQVPGALSDIIDNAKVDFAQIAAQNDIPSQVESGKGIQHLIERDQSRRADFYGRLAEFHAGLMSHCLCLVSRHYSENRLLSIKGRFGSETVQNFRGAQLRGQTDVTVNPGSLEPRSRAEVERRVLAFADRQWVSPEAAMSAINGGTAEALLESFELDVARANSIIQKIVEGPDVLFASPPRPLFPGEEPPSDELGNPLSEVPGWMPRPFDKIGVHKAVFEDWMKTSDYDALPPEQKVVANSYYSYLLRLEAQELARQQAEQQAMAEQLGMDNASKPQRAAPPPDQRNLDPDQG